MPDWTILTVTNDKKFLSLFRRRFHDQVARASRMIVAGTIDEACELLDTLRPRLIVVHWTSNGGPYEHLDQLLWAISVQVRQIPVVIIAERYRTDQATMMYRLGVSEYISRTHHLDQLGCVFSAYLPAPAADRPPIPAEAAGQSGKAWSTSHEAPAIASRAV
jgi:DNA-binding NarL/FixJ family response regulator